MCWSWCFVRLTEVVTTEGKESGHYLIGQKQRDVPKERQVYQDKRLPIWVHWGQFSSSWMLFSPRFVITPINRCWLQLAALDGGTGHCARALARFQLSDMVCVFCAWGLAREGVAMSACGSVC